jgi:lysophospholipid acyltransferase (LPLAT)-like uncharacterized protein
VIALARASGARLVPVGLSAAPFRRLGSWDRAILPRPFARVICSYGEPIHLPKKATDETTEGFRRELEATLDCMNLELDGELGVANRPGFAPDAH